MAVRIIDHARCGDLPDRILGATLAVGHVAGRVSGVGERIDAVRPPAGGGSHAPAIFQHQQQILDHAVLQRVGELQVAPIGDVALRVGDRDVAHRVDLAGVAVPLDPIGAETVALAQHPHVARRENDMILVIIVNRVGRKDDLVVRERCARPRDREGRRSVGGYQRGAAIRLRTESAACDTDASGHTSRVSRTDSRAWIVRRGGSGLGGGRHSCRGQHQRKRSGEPEAER